MELETMHTKIRNVLLCRFPAQLPRPKKLSTTEKIVKLFVNYGEYGIKYGVPTKEVFDIAPSAARRLWTVRHNFKMHFGYDPIPYVGKFTYKVANADVIRWLRKTYKV